MPNWAELSGYFSYSVITFRKATITILQVCFQHQNPVYLEYPKILPRRDSLQQLLFVTVGNFTAYASFSRKIHSNKPETGCLFDCYYSYNYQNLSSVWYNTKVSSPSAKQKFIWIFSYFYNLTKKQISKSMSTYDKIILFAYLLISLG